MATADFRTPQTSLSASLSTQTLDVLALAKLSLRFAGSLKITVWLFAVSLILVLVGTLAQDELNMLAVKNRYFVTWFAWLYLDDFFPQAFLDHKERIGREWPLFGSDQGARFPFLGGKMVGVLLFINLVAAKATRFKVHAKGNSLLSGIALLTIGLAITAAIVLTGHSSDGLQGNLPFSSDLLWAGTLAGATVLGSVSAMVGFQAKNNFVKVLGFIFAAVTAAALGYTFFTGSRIDESGLRIVWQLAKGIGAGAFLLAGAIFVFGKQGGNVVLHFGVALLMFGQFVFGDRQLEQRLTLVEGEASNSLINLDEIELSFIEKQPGVDRVIAVPFSLLTTNYEAKSRITDPKLPFDIEVRSIYPNADIVAPDPAKNAATIGIGLQEMAVAKSLAGGTDGEMNFPALYVELFEKGTDKSKGIHLASLMISDREALTSSGQTKDRFDEVVADAQTYQLGLRFHRQVKPYWIQLQDVQRINYSGSDTPRDYSSHIRIVDAEADQDRKERIWMNNPLRYRGETFYQSSYTPLPSGKEMTGIQVVKNSGWMIPYVACSISALGMLAHFFGSLVRFFRRYEREGRQDATKVAASLVNGTKDGGTSIEIAANTASSTAANRIAGADRRSLFPVTLTAVVASVVGFYLLVPWQSVKYGLRPGNRLQEFDFQTAGKIPVQFGGRLMPLDAYARQTLKGISNRESLAVDQYTPQGLSSRSGGKKITAMQWLMEVASDADDLRGLRMFRIDSEAVRSELNLERRSSKLYSLEEIGPGWAGVSRQVDAANGKSDKELDFKERKLVELDRRTRLFTLASASFGLPIPEPISEQEFKQVFPTRDPEDRNLFALEMLQRKLQALAQMSAPSIVAPSKSVAATAIDAPKWSPFSVGFFTHLTEVARNEETSAAPGIEAFGDMLKAYSDAERDPAAFNTAVDKLLSSVNEYPIAGYHRGRVALERWMQSNDPTYVSLYIYLAGLIVGLVGLLVGIFKPVPRVHWSVLAIVAVAFAIHTFAIFCRMYVTGRAPVINLYSSAVFIGWATVLFGISVEFLFRYGIGNLLSTFGGVASLLVAYGLTFTTTDTMPVLQAVLDTQFWLATHVISVTLGYVATLVAGLMGIGYLIVNWSGGSKDLRHTIYRCVYAASCFGILFSFVGTVLGGLWADDSWGRFWGWDPKENGALLIVIWNALMLHARWDGMVAARGFSLLAIGGNIVTAWSWFGTNELGIGLHSYGFTEGVLYYLSLFVASQLLFVIADGFFAAFKRATSAV
jgi:ABC-type transport system involved in cytochrome c biogenesis permease subunit